MALDQVLHIDATQLGTLRELHTGSRGRILAVPAVRINQRWPALYKEYHPELRAVLDHDALVAMVGLFTELDEPAERWLCERAAWPAAVVTRDGMPSGYLMCQAPAGLVAASEFLAGRASYLDGPTVRKAIREAEAVLAGLHGWDVTVGPLDPREFLLPQPAHAAGQPGCYLLGCDAFQRHGRAIVPPTDPARDPDTDRFLLAQLAGELLGALPPDPVAEPEPVTILGPAAVPTPTSAPEPVAQPEPVIQPEPVAGTEPLPANAPVVEAATVVRADQAPVPQIPVGTVPIGTVRPRRSRRWIAVLAGVIAILGAAGAVAFVLLRNGGTPAPVAPAPPAPEPSASATASAGPTASASSGVSPSASALVDTSAVATDPRAGDIAGMFTTYFAAINARDFDSAVAMYDPGGVVNPNDPKQRKSFADAVKTTTDSVVTLVSIGPGDGQVSLIPVRVTLVSHQQAGYGPKGRESETCTRWDVTYLLRSPAPHEYRIVRGTATNAPC